MSAVPDEPIHLGRFDRRDDARSCAPRDHHPHDGCSACIPKLLRPYRVVKRYRGDRQVGGFAQESWAELWRLQAGDVSWPSSRQG